MRNPGGYSIVSFIDNDKTIERDTFTCKHCQHVTFLETGRRMDPDAINRCVVCDKLICKFCVGKGCTPFEKQLELMERRDRLVADVRRR